MILKGHAIVCPFFMKYYIINEWLLLINKPPAQPPPKRGRLSPKGAGADFPFPPWGKMKGGDL